VLTIKNHAVSLMKRRVSGGLCINAIVL